MFFCSLMATVVSIVFACLAVDDFLMSKGRYDGMLDRFTGFFLLLGTICQVIVSGHNLIESFH
jgi:hypothetical protein